MIHIVQVRVSQGTGSGKALFGRCNADGYRRVDLGKGFLARHLHVFYAGIGTALDTALDVVPDLADRRRDTRCDGPAAVSGVGKGKIHAARHLYVAVIGPVVKGRAGAVGIGGCIVDHEGVYIAVALVEGQAESHAGIGAGALLVVGYGDAQGSRGLRPVFDGRVFHGPGFGYCTVADDSVHIPFQVIGRQRRAQRSLMGTGTGRRPCPAGKPVHSRRPGPGAAEYVVAGSVQQLAGRGLIQVQGHVVDDGSGFAVHLVPADAARHRRVKAGSGRIGIGRLDRLQIGKIPGFVNAYVGLVEHLVQQRQRGAHNVLHGFGSLVFGSSSCLGPLVHRIKTAVVLGIGSPLQGHGINGTAAVAGSIDVLRRHAAFGRARSLGAHGFIELFIGQLEIRVHLLHRSPFLSQLPGIGEGVLGFDLVLLFCCFLFKVVRICFDRLHGSVRAVVADNRHAVDAQRIHGDPRADGSVGLGAAQGQTAHNVGDGAVVVGRHGKVVCRFRRGLIIHQHQAVAVPGQHIDGTGGGQFAVCLARAEDDPGLGHVVGGVQDRFAAIRLHDNIFAGQNQAVAGEVLYRHAGAHAVAVTFGKGKVLAPVTRGADHIGIRRRVDLDILACGDIRLLAYGHDSLIVQFGNIQGSTYGHIAAALVIGLYRVAADIVIRVGSRAEYSGNVVNQTLYALIQFNQGIAFLVEEVEKGYGIIGKPGPGRILRNRAVFRLFLCGN